MDRQLSAEEDILRANRYDRYAGYSGSPLVVDARGTPRAHPLHGPRGQGMEPLRRGRTLSSSAQRLALLTGFLDASLSVVGMVTVIFALIERHEHPSVSGISLSPGLTWRTTPGTS